MGCQPILPLDPVPQAVADLRGRKGRAPPWGPNSFNFMQFWELLAKWYVGAPRELAPPPRGNPGSATDRVHRKWFSHSLYWSLYYCNVNVFVLYSSSSCPVPAPVQCKYTKINKNYELLCVVPDREHILFLPIITMEPTGNQTVCSLQNTLDPRSESKLFYCKL